MNIPYSNDRSSCELLVLTITPCIPTSPVSPTFPLSPLLPSFPGWPIGPSFPGSPFSPLRNELWCFE